MGTDADRLVNVVLVDDQQLVRAGVAFILSTEPGLRVVAEAENGELGVHAAMAHGPDVVMMDVRMPVMDGLEATRRIRDADGPPVLVLTTFDDDAVLWGRAGRRRRFHPQGRARRRLDPRRARRR